MHFDDRLATVLRHRAGSERAAKTQFRQLLDLLGNRRAARDESMLAAAWLRLAALGEAIAPEDRAEMIREPGLRFRNPELALHLAEDEPEVAAAALSVAQLSSDDWEALIPRLPIRARGFLRLRRDMPAATQELLERLGIRDRALPRPDVLVDEPMPSPPRARPVAANDLAGADDDKDSEIGALVRRIESFRKTRAARPAEEAPQLPLGERADGAARARSSGFAFSTDAEGRIDWADAPVAPMVVGAVLPAAAEGARSQHQPLRRLAVAWSGAPAVEGDWAIDAAPRFSDPGGRFVGYAGRFRRPPPPSAAAARADPGADRMRQLLHELKTPVNAIQGFAEVIQQQLFGPTPHEYRALAATIAGDAARMLAGFEELDRLARLESGALALDGGQADFATIVTGLARQLDEVLQSRGAGFRIETDGTPCPVPLSLHEAEALGWRLLATITGATGANEDIALRLTCDTATVRLVCSIPASLRAQDDVFAAESRAGGGAVSAGMFGAGFALRLARAEARAAGGDLLSEGDTLVLTLPRLTAA
ncbi:histidine kinase dimerization/phospho-acceptor domain-containing protein [Tsuneonella rigui]|uniref:histidine kinase dimerization/phospho-acceptor domain-containing protein n=1 Tax=Tsuneonella rigui TaxID=1708790 RepID=UPI000F7F67F0|nr:histidine kinase dimerization/phospho-acceptor domain-containing protein [Tsuneonella rigui]